MFMRGLTKLLRESFLSVKSTSTKPANDGLYSPLLTEELYTSKHIETKSKRVTRGDTKNYYTTLTGS